LTEWLEDEDTVDAKVNKRPKAISRRFRSPVQEEPKPEPALMRDASLPPKLEEKTSQPKSREHLLKQQRMPALRAPHSTKPGRSAGAGH
jgi:hypothetical protein